MSDVTELVSDASTVGVYAGRLPNAERLRERDRPVRVLRVDLEDVRAAEGEPSVRVAPVPANRPRPRVEAHRPELAHERAGTRPDGARHPRLVQQLEAGGDDVAPVAPQAGYARPHLQETERVVDPEAALHGGRSPEIVGRVEDPAPAAEWQLRPPAR